MLNARRAIAENEWVSNAGHRVWQLTGGVLRCSECGRAMSTNHILSRSAAYYRCAGHYQGGLARCPANRTIRAEKAEAEVWEFMRGLLSDPARLAAGLEKMQENEARTGGASAEEEEASWLKRLSEIERKEERLLDLRLEGDITKKQFRARSGALRETKDAATAGLEAARARRSRREDGERDKEALLEYHARLVPEDLDGLAPEQRRTLYRMMRLKVAVHDGALTTADWGCNDELTLPGSGRTRGR